MSSVPLGVLRWPLGALPRVIRAGIYPLSDQGFTHHYHQGSSHALHLYGYFARMRHGGVEVNLQPGDFTFSPRGGNTSYHLPQPGQHYCIHFEPARRNAAPDVALPLHAALGPWREGAERRVMTVVRHLAGAVPDAHAQAAASAALLELLLWMARHHQAPGAPVAGARALQAVERAAMLLERRLDAPLNVPQLAREVELSQNYLARLFRQRFGMTIPRYFLQRRMQWARDLLLLTDMPVSRVAEYVGMPDPQHFNKQFRRIVGQNPTSVRRG